MTPTREQVAQTVANCWDKRSNSCEVVDAIMELLEPKPLARLLVEEVSPDQDSAVQGYSRPWVSIKTTKAIRVRELPPMPSMEQLEYVYGEAYIGDPGDVDDSSKAGIAAVLRACGLEVEEAKR